MANSPEGLKYDEQLKFIPDMNALYLNEESFNQQPIFYPMNGQQRIEDSYLNHEQQTCYNEKYCDHSSRYNENEDYFRKRVTTAESPVNQDMIRMYNTISKKQKSSQVLLRSHARIKNSRPKKSRNNTTDEKVPTLKKPLSELTKDLTDIHVMDIETYVNRSSQERRDSVKDDEKCPGKVKRPMNSFMLYRKAFQNIAKIWCSLNNHQNVSRVCGKSWPLEPDSVKKQFEAWSRVERYNHHIAFPQYKFSPSKTGKGRSDSKQSITTALSSDDSELENYYWKKQPRNEKQDDSLIMPASHVKQKVERACLLREQSRDPYLKKANCYKSFCKEKQEIVPLDVGGLQSMASYQQPVQESEFPLEIPAINMENYGNISNLPDQINYCPYKSYPPGNLVDPCQLILCQMPDIASCSGDEFSQNFCYEDLELLMRRNWEQSRGVDFQNKRSIVDPGPNPVVKESHGYVLNEDGWPGEVMDHEKFDEWLVNS